MREVRGSIPLSSIFGLLHGIRWNQHSKFLLSPFSKRMISDSKLNEDKSTLWKILSVIAFIIYLPFGILASIITLIQICLLFISIVGIPVALVLAKSLSTYFNPIGKVCIDYELADELNKRKAKEKADKILN